MPTPLLLIRFLLLGLMLSAGVQTARADGYYGTLTGSLVDDVNGDGLVNVGDSLEYSVAVEIEGVGRPSLTLEFLIPPEQTFSHIRSGTNQSDITILSGDQPDDTTLKFDIGNPPYSFEATAVVFFRVLIGLDTPPDTTLSVKGTFAYPDDPTGTTTLTTDTNTVSFDIVNEPDVYNGTLTGSLVDDLNNDGLVDLGDILEFSLPIIVTGDGRSDLALEFHIPPRLPIPIFGPIPTWACPSMWYRVIFRVTPC